MTVFLSLQLKTETELLFLALGPYYKGYDYTVVCQGQRNLEGRNIKTNIKTEESSGKSVLRSNAQRVGCISHFYNGNEVIPTFGYSNEQTASPHYHSYYRTQVICSFDADAVRPDVTAWNLAKHGKQQFL